MRVAFAILLLTCVAGDRTPAAEEDGGEPPNPFGPRVVKRRDAVPGKLVRSDGQVHRGGIFLTRDKRLELYCDGEKKWYKLKLKELSKLEWVVEFEREEKEWRWKEPGSDVKVYTGRKKIDRKYKTVATRKDGRKIEGHIRGTVIYVQPKEGRKRRFFLYWNHPSDFDQKPEDLVHTKEIHFGAEHAKAPPRRLGAAEVKAIVGVLEALAAELKKLAGRYPEMRSCDAGSVKLRGPSRFELRYRHDVRVLPKDYEWGKHGVIITFQLGPPGAGQPFERMRSAELPKLGLRLCYGVRTGKSPSAGLVAEIDKLLAGHRDKLKRLEAAAGGTNKPGGREQRK
jgi:hypothetical protein